MATFTSQISHYTFDFGVFLISFRASFPNPIQYQRLNASATRNAEVTQNHDKCVVCASTRAEALDAEGPMMANAESARQRHSRDLSCAAGR